MSKFIPAGSVHQEKQKQLRARFNRVLKLQNAAKAAGIKLDETELQKLSYIKDMEVVLQNYLTT